MMKWTKTLTGLILLSQLAATSLAWADKPAWAGRPDKHSDKHGNSHKDAEQTYSQGNLSYSLSFSYDDRRVLSDYYQTEAKRGHCPPGLAKKNNGCLPPGQAKKWRRGEALASDLRYTEVPLEIRRRLSPLPPSHRYVQIAGDILIIAAATRLVVDAVEDILR